MSDLDSDNKRCKDCGEVKPASESWRCEQSSDGLSLYGKECFGLSDAAAYRKRQAAIGKTPRAYRRHSRVPEGVKHCARSAETKPITDPGRDPAWTPNCSRCNVRLPERTGSGRRLCDDCFGQTYDLEDRRSNGAHRVRLKPCSLCGGPKERMARGKMCQACKPWAGYATSLRRFDLTPADYVAILQAQGGVCSICHERPRGQRLSIDHDHALPEGRAAVRGLLCRDCNYSRLPRFEEDVAMLQRAISYLTAPPARSVIAEGAHRGVSVRPTDLGLSATGEDDGAP